MLLQPYELPGAKVIVLYSAFAFDLATIFYFLLFQDIKLPPTRTQFPKVEYLSASKYLTI